MKKHRVTILTCISTILILVLLININIFQDKKSNAIGILNGSAEKKLIAKTLNDLEMSSDLIVKVKALSNNSQTIKYDEISNIPYFGYTMREVEILEVYSNNMNSDLNSNTIFIQEPSYYVNDDNENTFLITYSNYMPLLSENTYILFLNKISDSTNTFYTAGIESGKHVLHQTITSYTNINSELVNTDLEVLNCDESFLNINKEVLNKYK